MKTEKFRMRPVVAILGGGVAGAATAFHLARALRGKRADIVVVEPRPVLGHGLAYSTTDPAHRTNVPASRMSLIREDPGHFMAWLASTRAMLSPGTLTLSGEFYPERHVFGGYVAAQLEPFLADGAIRHVRAAAVSATRAGERFRIELSDGGVLRADIAVLAMSHPCPALPDELRALSGSRRLIADPCDAAAIAGIGPAERLLIVGTGLTSADVVASLKLRGFWGEVVALSRHGLRPRGHCAVRIRCDVDFTVPPAASARALLRRVRATIATDAARGRSWHSTMDRVREQGQALWQTLGETERARLVRHVRPFWDVHRFRVSPQVEAVLDREVAAGKLAYIAARLVRVTEAADGVRVEYRPRGRGEVVVDRFDTVVVTTGPAHRDALRTNPVLMTMAQQGLVHPDPLGMGLLRGGSLPCRRWRRRRLPIALRHRAARTRSHR